MYSPSKMYPIPNPSITPPNRPKAPESGKSSGLVTNPRPAFGNNKVPTRNIEIDTVTIKIILKLKDRLLNLSETTGSKYMKSNNTLMLIKNPPTISCKSWTPTIILEIETRKIIADNITGTIGIVKFFNLYVVLSLNSQPK